MDLAMDRKWIYSQYVHRASGKKYYEILVTIDSFYMYLVQLVHVFVLLVVLPDVFIVNVHMVFKARQCLIGQIIKNCEIRHDQLDFLKMLPIDDLLHIFENKNFLKQILLIGGVLNQRLKGLKSVWLDLSVNL